MLRFASSSVRRRGFASSSFWKYVEEGPLDANKATTVALKADPNPNKVNLGEGIYKDDTGKCPVLPCIREAEARLAKANADHEYCPISGIPSFCKSASQFAFGADSSLFKENRIATVQTLSGTGALRIGADFVAKFLPKATPVFISDPTWVNHRALFQTAGCEVRTYKWYDKAKNALDIDGCLKDLRNAPLRSVILLHACAHNPTGIDPTMEQWKKISDACLERNHIVFFDNAYQGFASGDPDKDAAGFRHFINQGHQLIVAQSFAKNMGMYGERVGALNIMTGSEQETTAVDSQLKIIIRANYSSPPLFGARLVDMVLSEPALKKQWFVDVKEMADRIALMRSSLVQNLGKAGSKLDWSHITNQIGMFAFSGLGEKQVMKLRSDFSVYMNKDGRMSIAGINSRNVEYLAKAIHEVTRS
ncbi:mitochondrial aspartate aminotransferase [Andalucia godoyi]|uniref:Aspartate aminotransferase n=1 Tax=Andalucia godoyi TaxID=505711 RepID=A0A8K0F0M5_ANDGO|nr:mitochondrial aspartate aminotransferase [Andalucia godoyi]|eukprot:ANDGO_05918.mRNA.1 mitochondrial aspartate aminotransferase